jgi:putative ABC transport system permease protein
MGSLMAFWVIAMQPCLSIPCFVWRNLGRRRFRSLITLAGVAIATSAYVALVGFTSSFEHEWMKVYSTGGTEITVAQRVTLMPSLDESLGARIAKLPSVQKATPMLMEFASLSTDQNAIVYGWKADSFEFQSIQIIAGRQFRDGSPEVMVGEALARGLRKGVGDRIEIQGGDFTIVATYRASSALESGAVIMPLDQLQFLTSKQGKVAVFHVKLRATQPNETPEQLLAEAQKEIERVIPQARAMPAASRASSNQFSSVARSIAAGTSWIALALAILGISNTMMMSVGERISEFALLRALGWSRLRVIVLVETEAAALGALGGIIGVAAGWAILISLAAIPQTAGVVSSQFPATTVLQALSISLLAGLLSGILPALRGTRSFPGAMLKCG